jgi:hypothetical protein
MAEGDSGLLSPEEIEILLNRVCSRSPRTSSDDLVAIRLLGKASLTDEQRWRIAATFSRWIRMDLTGEPGATYRFGAAMLLVSTAIIPMVIYAATFSRMPFGPGIGAMLAFICLAALPLAALYEIYRWNRARAAYIQTLGEIRCPLGVITLLGATQSPIARLREAAEKSLVALLRSIDLSTVPDLPRQARMAALHLLPRSPESPALALLHLLEQCGDADACQPVAALARTSRNARVKARALEVLAILEERRKQARNEAHLLRASSPDVSPDTLLRPGSASQAPPAELLRPTDKRDV